MDNLDGLVHIKTHNDVQIFYNINDGMIYITTQDTGEQLHFKYVFEAERRIDEPVWEDCDLKGYVKDGIFINKLLRVVADKRDIKSGQPIWRYAEGYDKGKPVADWGRKPRVYPATPENRQLHKDWERQHEVVEIEESKLRSIVAKLKDGTQQGKEVA